MIGRDGGGIIEHIPAEQARTVMAMADFHVTDAPEEPVYEPDE